VANLTMVGRPRSIIKRAGIAYSQYYAMQKHELAANKHYPWPAEDDSMALMTVSSQKLEALRAKAGARKMDMRAARRSFLHSGRRFLMKTRMNDDRF